MNNYTKRRKRGLRGQGERLGSVFRNKSEEVLSNNKEVVNAIGSHFLNRAIVNRRAYRAKVVDRAYSKKNAKHTHKASKRAIILIGTNHERVLSQRKTRDERRRAKREARTQNQLQA